MNFDKVIFWCRKEKVGDNKDTYNAFPVDKNKDQSTAITWASEKICTNSNVQNWNDRTYKKVDGVKFEYDNKFDNLVIEDLSKRGNGGRAYKVVINHDNKKFLVDFREDAIMDVIKHTGINAGGKLNGEFSFIKEGSQTNLVRIGSKMYERFLDVQEKNNTETFKMKELIPLHIYKDKKDDLYLYLGKAYFPRYETKNVGDGWYNKKVDRYLQIDKNNIECLHVFYSPSIYKIDDKTYKEAMFDKLKESLNKGYISIDIVKSKTNIISDLGELDITTLTQSKDMLLLSLQQKDIKETIKYNKKREDGYKSSSRFMFMSLEKDKSIIQDCIKFFDGYIVEDLE